MSKQAIVRLGVSLLLVTSFLALYAPVLRKLVHDWATDDNYSHGFLILPLASYLVWERRARLRALPLRPSLWGFVLVLASLALLCVGILGAELFLTRISLISLVAGTTLFLCGWRWLRALAFPTALLILMVPLPALIFNQIAIPLQLVASRFGEAALVAFQVPVFRQGNVMVLAHTTLEVAEACSGIRSLVSLLTLGLFYGYFADKRLIVRLVITLSTIPIAIVANGLRVAGTGLAAHYVGPEAAEGFFHTFSGWLVFVAAFAGVFAVHYAIVLTLKVLNQVRFGSLATSSS